jgi:hypothetical protein
MYGRSYRTTPVRRFTKLESIFMPFAAKEEAVVISRLASATPVVIVVGGLCQP